MAFNIDSIAGYVEQHKSELIAKAVLGAKTISQVRLMTGVKGQTTLNLIDDEIAIKNGTLCRFNASGNTTLSQRVMKPQILKVDKEWCPRDLVDTYKNTEILIAAGKETLPFEEKLLNMIADNIAAGLEKMVWFGDADDSDDEFDGYITVLNAASAETINVTEASGTTASKAILDTYMAIPAEIVNKDNTVIFVSEGTYRAYIQELIASNNYHYTGEYDNGEVYIPGTKVKVIAVNGLNPTTADTYEYVVAGQLSNFFYGTDLEGDAEEKSFDLWYSKDDRTYKFEALWVSGAQVAYPDEIVVTKIAK